MTSARGPQGGEALQERFAVAFILGYRVTMYPVYRLIGLTGQHRVCKLTPSCSHYGEEAVQTHGLGRAIVMTSARLRRCGKTGHVEDPVPAAPYSPTRDEQVEAGKMLASVGAVMIVCLWAGDRIGSRIGSRIFR